MWLSQPTLPAILPKLQTFKFLSKNLSKIANIEKKLHIDYIIFCHFVSHASECIHGHMTLVLYTTAACLSLKLVRVREQILLTN